MLDYETKVEEAKAAGLEPPPITSLFNPQAKPLSHSVSTSNTIEAPGDEQLPENLKDPKLRSSLKEMTPHEREVEIQALKAKFANKHMYEHEVSDLLSKEDAARAIRREKMNGWFGEAIGSWLT
jgi:hypothetical protein